MQELEEPNRASGPSQVGGRGRVPRGLSSGGCAASDTRAALSWGETQLEMCLKALDHIHPQFLCFGTITLENK